MKFESEELKTTFEVPGPVSYRQALRYASEVELNPNRADMYERLWRGVQVLAQGWSSPHVSLDAGMDDPLTPAGLRVIKWAGLAVFGYVEGLKEIPLA